MSLKESKTWNLDAASQVAQLYDEARKLSPNGQKAFLDRLQARNPSIASEVRLMLSSNHQFDRFLEKPPAHSFHEENSRKKAPKFSAGDKIGEFRIIRELGAGGLASVYLARQLGLDREVALKVSHADTEEARTLAHLDHDHIVKIYAEGMDKERELRYIAMQYVRGMDLASVIEKLRKRPVEKLSGADILQVLNLFVRAESASGFSSDAPSIDTTEPLAEMEYREAALWIIAKLATALDYAHRKGILHLDIKPSNIMIQRSGRPLLTDFNVSLDSRAVAEGKLSQIGGTYDYMAPEQRAIFTAEDPLKAIASIDQRADIYSLGIVLREFLLAPYESLSEKDPEKISTVTRLLGEPIQRTQGRHSGNLSRLDFNVRHIIKKCLAEDPKDRFQSAAAMAHALESCLELRSIVRAIPSTGFLSRRGSKNPFLSLVRKGLFPLFVASVFCSFVFLRVALGDMWENYLLSIAPLIAWATLAVFWGGRLVWVHQLISNLGASKEGYRRAREISLFLPLWFFGAASFIWLPVIVFCLVWHAQYYKVSSHALGLLLVGVPSIGLIAIGYALLGIQSAGLRFLYPRLWLGENDISERASHELVAQPGFAKLASFFIVFVPLISSVGIFLDPTIVENWVRTVPLSVSLGILILLGTIFSATRSHWLSRFLSAFLPRESSSAVRTSRLA